MDEVGRRILDHLAAVQAERATRAADAGLAQRVSALKAFQHARLERTYADLLAEPPSAPAARFFLDELYGPRDFSARDTQFARVVPALVRLFPGAVAAVVERVAALHALSERLDTDMARVLPPPPVDASSYGQAWRTIGQSTAREHQIEAVVEIGLALERQARRPLLRQTLHWMRGPAQAAGLAELQAFLEAGLDAFASLPSAADFLDTVSRRERALAAELFAGCEATTC
ncbi:MAG: FFLEELY motif protein [Rubrivivax sp.]